MEIVTHLTRIADLMPLLTILCTATIENTLDHANCSDEAPP